MFGGSVLYFWAEFEFKSSGFELKEKKFGSIDWKVLEDICKNELFGCAIIFLCSLGEKNVIRSDDERNLFLNCSLFVACFFLVKNFFF